jgi:5-hydroxyisourate hydrolase
MGRLSTHVLDTARGLPAAGMRIDLLRGSGPSAREVLSITTDRDGRTDGPLLQGEDLEAGAYQLRFHVGAYFRDSGHADGGRFLEIVPVSFVVEDPQAHYHVPLLVSPWSYTTYRGS